MAVAESALTKEKYCAWAKETLGIDYSEARIKIYYQTNAVAALSAVQESTFLKGLDSFLGNCDEDYRQDKKANLLMSREPLELIRKSYESVIDKSYRYNCLWNERFPEEPKARWVKPDNWFSKLNDIVRGTLICKYADGPKWLSERLGIYSEEMGLKSRYYSQQSDEGYYAYHFYVKIPITLATLKYEEYNTDLSVEIQITTQLQDVLRKMTHEYYKKSRTGSGKPDDWKWELGSDKFRTSYLSHTLHLLEAIIVELRDKTGS